MRGLLTWTFSSGYSSCVIKKFCKGRQIFFFCWLEERTAVALKNVFILPICQQHNKPFVLTMSMVHWAVWEQKQCCIIWMSWLQCGGERSEVKVGPHYYNSILPWRPYTPEDIRLLWACLLMWSIKLQVFCPVQNLQRSLTKCFCCRKED